MHPEQQLSIARKSEGATSMASFSPTGAALEKLSLRGVPVIDIDRVPAANSMFFGPALAPWPNRIANHSYQFEGEQFSTPNVDQDGNSNHGLVFNRDFDVLTKSDSSIQFHYGFGSDKSYPFEVSLDIEYSISDSELIVRSVATAKDQPAPFGLGFHPYFLVGQKFRLSADFNQHILTNEKMIPTGQERIRGLVYEGGGLDDCFSGAREVQLQTENYSLTISLDQGFDYFMLYRPSLDCGESLLAIEPMSCVANAFNSDLGAVTLKPNEQKEFIFSIKMN